MKLKVDVAGLDSKRVFLSKGKKWMTGPPELSWLVNFPHRAGHCFSCE